MEKKYKDPAIRTIELVQWLSNQPLAYTIGAGWSPESHTELLDLWNTAVEEARAIRRAYQEGK